MVAEGTQGAASGEEEEPGVLDEEDEPPRLRLVAEEAEAAAADAAFSALGVPSFLAFHPFYSWPCFLCGLLLGRIVDEAEEEGEEEEEEEDGDPAAAIDARRRTPGPPRLGWTLLLLASVGLPLLGLALAGPARWARLWRRWWSSSVSSSSSPSSPVSSSEPAAVLVVGPAAFDALLDKGPLLLPTFAFLLLSTLPLGRLLVVCSPNGLPCASSPRAGSGSSSSSSASLGGPDGAGLNTQTAAAGSAAVVVGLCRWLGELAWPLFMLHWPVYQAVHRYTERFGGLLLWGALSWPAQEEDPGDGPPSSVAAAFLMLGLQVAVAAAVHALSGWRR